MISVVIEPGVLANPLPLALGVESNRPKRTKGNQVDADGINQVGGPVEEDYGSLCPKILCRGKK